MFKFKRNNSSTKLEDIHLIYEFPLEAIFDVPEAKEEFRAYLKREHNEEPLLFYEEVEDFKRLKFEENKTKKALFILKTYVMPNSSHEINISSQYRQNIVLGFEKSGQLTSEKNMLVDETIFDDSQSAIFYNLKNDTYPRFTKSVQFNNFLKQKDEAFITSISVLKNTKYMEYIPKFDGLVCDRDIQFFSFMAFNDDEEVWDEIKVGASGRRACYQSKKEFNIDENEEKANGKLLKQVFILPCSKEQAFNMFSHTQVRQDILDAESINQLDYIPISKTNKYAQSILKIVIQMTGLTWVMKPRQAVVAGTVVKDTKRNCIANIMKSTNSVLLPEKKSHVKARVLSSSFFVDCYTTTHLNKLKDPPHTNHSMSSGDLRKSTSSASSTSSFSRKSSVAFDDSLSDMSTESFGPIENACKVICVSYIDLQSMQSDFIRKKFFNAKNKAAHTVFMNSVKEFGALNFPKPKFSEGLYDTLDAFTSHYTTGDNDTVMTWDLEEEEEGNMYPCYPANAGLKGFCQM
ncbi:RGS domain-containing protein [Naegleria gruberi]|uniref:RGS domain-containing protein n=1 Tax=Naegleria gruberi TaxID=5762 RepID=D2VVY4_NAEGR|nr:RGS domain-containing protein [Naegleria gruberi]EFC38923.1 RGS domain-containing protein [Naegleria gruberi]|eukprot:XP_002671667.1 RGS domain-containing protein [Naegleria gruberi strain NEG-M]